MRSAKEPLEGCAKRPKEMKGRVNLGASASIGRGRLCKMRHKFEPICGCEVGQVTEEV